MKNWIIWTIITKRTVFNKIIKNLKEKCKNRKDVNKTTTISRLLVRQHMSLVKKTIYIEPVYSLLRVEIKIWLNFNHLTVATWTQQQQVNFIHLIKQQVLEQLLTMNCFVKQNKKDKFLVKKMNVTRTPLKITIIHLTTVTGQVETVWSLVKKKNQINMTIWSNWVIK